MNKDFRIHDERDLAAARMQVREQARLLGMSLTDQSRISLAASSLANSLGLGREGNAEGHLSVESLQNGARRGLRVVCVRTDCGGFIPPLSYFVNERWMVDDLEMETPSPDEVKIIMTKWIHA